MELSNMHSLSGETLEQLIQETLSYEELVSQMAVDRRQASKLVGSLLQGVPTVESRVLQLACGRLGYNNVELGWDDAKTKSDEDLINDFSMFSSAVDLIVAGFVDRETLGAGHAIIKRVAEISEVPMISLADEVFAPQSAIGVAASFWERLGALKGKRIAVCWGFGSSFVMPNTAHSLLLICTSLGADVLLASPPDFGLLRRVVRDAAGRAKQSGSRFEESADLQEFLRTVDAVFATNWCRLDDFNHPERNAEHASQFREWHFTKENLPSDCLFMSEPPIQSDLLLDVSLQRSDRNLTNSWVLKRMQALTASMKHVDRGRLGDEISVLI